VSRSEVLKGGGACRIRNTPLNGFARQRQHRIGRAYPWERDLQGIEFMEHTIAFQFASRLTAACQTRQCRSLLPASTQTHESVQAAVTPLSSNIKLCEWVIVFRKAFFFWKCTHLNKDRCAPNTRRSLPPSHTKRLEIRALGRVPEGSWLAEDRDSYTHTARSLACPHTQHLLSAPILQRHFQVRWPLPASSSLRGG